MSRISKSNQPEITPAALPEPDLAASVATWERTWLYLAIILLAGLFVAAPAFQGTWLWDDDQEITANAALVSMKGTDGLSAIWSGNVGADYLPLKSTFLWIEYQFWGANHVGYHLITTFFHLLNALMIWYLFRQLRIKAAWLGGLLFAIHPALVESVAWVSEQKNTLSLAFLLPAMIFYLKYDERLQQENLSKAWLQGLLAVLFFTASLLCKSTGVMMPLTILLYAWWKYSEMCWQDLLAFMALGCFLGVICGIGYGIWHSNSSLMIYALVLLVPGGLLAYAWSKLRGSQGQAILHTLYSAAPFFIIAFIIGVITIDFQNRIAIGNEWIPVGGYLSRTLGAGLLIFFYTYLSVIPFDLCPIYPKWDLNPDGNMYLILLWPLLAAILLWFWYKRKTWGKHVLFGYGFFLIYLIPVLGFATMSYMRITWAADHFVYVPLIGIIGLAVVAINHCYQAVPLYYKKLTLCAFIVLFMALTGYAHRYSAIFLNEADMWTYTLEKNPDAWQAHSRYGKVLLDQGNIDAAFYHIFHSNRLRPDLAETNNNMGVLLMQKNRPLEAIPYMQKAATIMPDAIPFRANLANLLTNTGRAHDALPHYEFLISRAPNNPIFRANYGYALYMDGQRDAGIAQVKTALQLDPNLVNAKQYLQLMESGSKLPLPNQKGQTPPPPNAAAAEVMQTSTAPAPATTTATGAKRKK